MGFQFSFRKRSCDQETSLAFLIGLSDLFDLLLQRGLFVCDPFLKILKFLLEYVSWSLLNFLTDSFPSVSDSLMRISSFSFSFKSEYFFSEWSEVLKFLIEDLTEGAKIRYLSLIFRLWFLFLGLFLNLFGLTSCHIL